MLEEVKMNCELTGADLYRNAEINHNNVSVATIKRKLNFEGMVARRMPRTHNIRD